MPVRLIGAALVIFAGAVLLTLLRPYETSAQENQEQAVGSIEVVIFQDKERPKEPVSVTLYRNGKVFATMEGKLAADSRVFVFFELPFDSYELRIEVPEHTTVVKKVVLRKQEKKQRLETTLRKGKGSIVYGGPTIEELEDRIKKLEETVAKLQNK